MSDSRLEVVFIPEVYGDVMSPCAHIRVHGYLKHLHVKQVIRLRVVRPNEIRSTSADVYIWHRTALSKDEVSSLAKHAHAQGARLCFDLDDNLLRMDDHPEASSYRGVAEQVRASLDCADVVWASTQQLALSLQPFNDGVELQPNALDPNIWQPRPPTKRMDEMVRILYMGTRTHEEDFRFLSSVLDRATSAGMKVSATVIGVRSSDTQKGSWLTYRYPPDHVGASYPAFVTWLADQEGFDLGVAPLLDSVFNESKSAIKVFDYAALGLPSIASDVFAYRDTRIHAGIHCLLAENTEASWIEAIQTMTREDERMRLASNAQSLVTADVFERELSRRVESLTGARNV